MGEGASVSLTVVRDIIKKKKRRNIKDILLYDNKIT